MSVRFIIQPMVSTTLAIRAGVRDAHAHRPAFLWSLLSDSRRRKGRLVSAWRDVSVLFSVAVGLDVVYQIGVLRFFYPLQAVAVAAALALGPYVICRGLANRVVIRYRAWSRPPLFRGQGH